MKIKINKLERCTLEQFAEKHKLTMTVNERDGSFGDLAKYYASFDHVEVKQGIMLKGEYGNGSTVDAAINNYMKLISGEKIVHKAMSKDRRDITVPILCRSVTI